MSAPAFAGAVLPTGGQYVAGTGSIATSASGLTVDQSSSRGIIDWKSFSIGAGKGVFFNNGSGATLNRVTGAGQSDIDGLLGSTGSVFLINPNGVVIGAGGKVVTNGSFVASTRDMTDNSFMAGGTYDFAGTSSGSVVNAGSIASGTGDVVLIGRSVTNNGSISAQNGRVGLAAGDAAVLRPVNGDQRISVASGTGSVTNRGAISATAAELKAADGNVYALAGNNGGIVRATGTQTIGGHIWLTSNDGAVKVTGTLVAGNADGSGGAVTVRGSTIGVSGTVDASAAQPGRDGGSVSIVATDTTAFSGTIRAQGGRGGKGGVVETSGAHLHVADGAKVDTRAQDGVGGKWLLDPNDFTIAAAGGDMTGATLSSNLGTTDVEIKSDNGVTAGNGDIFVNDAVSWSSDHTLTLTAVSNIDFNANVTATGTNAGLILNYGGDYGFAAGKSLTLSGANASLTMNGTGFTLLHSMADVQAINADQPALQGNYALAQSLDAATTTGWVPIGTDGAGVISNHGFSGVFAGLGHTVSNLTVSSLSSAIGLFGASSGTIRDVGVVNAAVIGVSDVGALIGINNGTVANAYSTGTVTGFGAVGGLIGDSSGDVSNSYSSSLVTGEIVPGSSSSGNPSPLGGLIGEVDAGSVTFSHASGNVTAADGNYMGGLIGQTNVGVTVANDYATGDVTATSIVNGGAIIGGLIGDSYDSVTNSYATGNVSGEQFVGGLIGSAEANSVVSQSYATGSVTGDANSIGLGGLIGTSNGISETDVYATGAVIGGDMLGGLIGLNESQLTNAYATGFVGPASGALPSAVGALVGENDGTITNGYWDTDTSGQSGPIGQDGGFDSTITSATTAELQGTLPSGFLNSVWGTGAGLYPYFLWQYPSTPQAISGFAYSNAGVTPLASGPDGAIAVSALANGAGIGSSATGANGYYYILVAPGVIGGVQNALVYLNGGAVKANTYVETLPAGATSADLYGGFVRMLSGLDTSSAIFAGLTAALGGNSGGDFLYASGSFASGASLDLESSNGSGLTVDNAIDLGKGKVFVRTTAPGGNLALNASLTGGQVNLTSGGTISEDVANGQIHAARLTGSSNGDATLNGANSIAYLGDFAPGGGAFALTDAASLGVLGAIDTGSKALTLTTTGAGHNLTLSSALGGGTVTLDAAATIWENLTTGKITATTLTGSGGGDTKLNGTNQIDNLGSFTNTGGNFSLNDAVSLAVSGAVDTGALGLTLVTTGAGHGLSLNALLTGGIVTLTSAGTISQDLSDGMIDAARLTGSSVGDTTLDGANTIKDLDGFAVTGNTMSLTNAQTLGVGGDVTAGSSIDLTTTSGNLRIRGTGILSASTVTLDIAGKAFENAAGRIDADLLNVTAGTGIKLDGDNSIVAIGTDHTDSGPDSIDP